MKHDRPEVDGQDPIFLPNNDCNNNVNKTALVQVTSIPTNTRAERNIAAMVRPNKTTAVRLKYQKSCSRLRRNHLHHVRRASDVDAKIFIVHLVDERARSA